MLKRLDETLEVLIGGARYAGMRLQVVDGPMATVMAEKRCTASGRVRPGAEPFAQAGEMPLPPYIHEPGGSGGYQTVYVIGWFRGGANRGLHYAELMDKRLSAVLLRG